jgi:hypothetical protein
MAAAVLFGYLAAIAWIGSQNLHCAGNRLSKFRDEGEVGRAVKQELARIGNSVPWLFIGRLRNNSAAMSSGRMRYPGE